MIISFSSVLKSFVISVNGSKLDTHKHWALLLVPIVEGKGPSNSISKEEMDLRAQINIQVNTKNTFTSHRIRYIMKNVNFTV